MNKKCGTCKFWSFKGSGFRPMGDEKNRTCLKMNNVAGYIQSDKVFAWSISYYEESGVMTNAEFGCVMYEKKEE